MPSFVQGEAAVESGSNDAEQPLLMIVDDDPHVRTVLSDFLAEFGYRVVSASGGAQALDLLAAIPDLRLIITDIRMPGMSGIELARIAVERRSDLKIIMISGHFEEQQVERRFLRKPFRMRELERAVREELNTGAFPEPRARSPDGAGRAARG